MLATLITVNVLGFIFLYIIVFRYIKRTDYYGKLIEIYKQARKAPAKVTSKSDIRRLRKYRPYIRVFRRKMITLTLLNIGLFMAVYTATIFTTLYLISRYTDTYPLLESPVIIPFLSFIDYETGRIYIYPHIVVLIAFITTLYPVTREMKIQD
ncbi:MAG: hypothetical protein QXE81_03855 [Desulfurococcaceae archaeon]